MSLVFGNYKPTMSSCASALAQHDNLRAPLRTNAGTLENHHVVMNVEDPNALGNLLLSRSEESRKRKLRAPKNLVEIRRTFS
jgi:hypothetical protein